MGRATCASTTPTRRRRSPSSIKRSSTTSHGSDFGRPRSGTPRIISNSSTSGRATSSPPTSRTSTTRTPQRSRTSAAGTGHRADPARSVTAHPMRTWSCSPACAPANSVMVLGSCEPRSTWQPTTWCCATPCCTGSDGPGTHGIGNDWLIYPTYDWAYGQVDALEGITHSVATLEFGDHRPLYDWFLAHLDLPAAPPTQIEFARLNLTHTVTSKRLLRQLIDTGAVDCWDDPRLPTLQGLRRRGYPPRAIIEFLKHIGVARTNNFSDIELLEPPRANRTCPDRYRRMVGLRSLKVVITNWPDGHVEWVDVANNPERPGDVDPPRAVHRSVVDRTRRLQSRTVSEVLPGQPRRGVGLRNGAPTSPPTPT